MNTARSENFAITPLLPFRWETAGICASALLQASLLVSTSNSNVDRSVEDLVHAVHLFGRALHVHGAHLVRDCAALLLCDGCQALRFEELDAGSLVAQVGFQAAEDDGSCWAEVQDLGIPLVLVSRSLNGDAKFAYLVKHILERVGTIDGKADEEQICLWVGKRSQSVVLFLSGSIPEC